MGMKTRPLIFAASCVLIAACGSPPIRAELFEPVYRAAKSIQSATTVGVTYAAHGDLLRALAAEIEIVKGRAESPEEVAVVADLEKAVEAYKDSATIFGLKVRHGPVIAPYQDIEIVALAKKYGVDAGEHGNYFAESILQLAWVRASEHVDSAMAKYAAGTKK